jgi:CRP-like cAMP-binding protein
MKLVDGSWNHPELSRFVNKFPAGTPLFKQGAVGESFFLIRRGIVRLTAERDGQELMVSLLEAGAVLGEKCLISDKPHKRFFGAIAHTEVLAAELRASDMAALEGSAPAVAMDILKKVCQVSISRLDRIDHMVKVLRSADNIERLVYLIVHFAYFEGNKESGGYRVIAVFEVQPALVAAHGAAVGGELDGPAGFSIEICLVLEVASDRDRLAIHGPRGIRRNRDIRIGESPIRRDAALLLQVLQLDGAEVIGPGAYPLILPGSRRIVALR